MKPRMKLFVSWLLQYLVAGIVSVSALFFARNYVKTNFELLISDLPKENFSEVITFLEEEYVPYRVSVDKKRIKVPNYEIPRLKQRMKEVFNTLPEALHLAKGGY